MKNIGVGLRWDTEALAAFGDAMEYIAGDSYAAAIGVSDDIQVALDQAVRYPFANPPDKYRADSNPAFRAFELHNFRVSYYVSTDELFVVRFRHVKQRPEMY